MEKILSINFKPFFTGYASHANFDAIMSSTAQYKEWLFSNYIQLMSKKNFEVPHDVPLDFFIDIKRDNCYYLNNPYLYVQCIKKELVNTICKDIVEFIIEAIDHDMYVDICLNEYYIPVKNAYKRCCRPHNNMIYGYNKNKKCFYVVGYIQHNANSFMGTYGAFRISFDVLSQAYKNCPYVDWFKSIYLYSVESHGGTLEKYRFNLEAVIRSLEDYLYSRNSLSNYYNIVPKTDRFSFGLDVYRDLLNNWDRGYYHMDDIRPLELLVEHKKCMVNRIVYLYSERYISKEDYEILYMKSYEILKYALKARYIQIKYIISGRGDLSYYRKLLIEMPKLERDLYEGILLSL